MDNLIIIRIISGLIGLFFVYLAFIQYRKRIIRRFDYFALSFLGLALIIVSAYPDSINVIAGMLALDNRQYGRLIALLIISNLLLWVSLVGLKMRDEVKSKQFDLLVRRLATERFFQISQPDAIKEITVIIPALNEAENLDHLLPEIPNSVFGRELGVLVIDDGSTDDTPSVVKKHRYAVISNPINRGGGAALRLGYDIAAKAGATYIVTMDADGQHRPGEIQSIIRPLLEEDFDIVIGSRVLGKREKDNALRWIGIHIFNYLINFLAGSKITDCSNGFRAFRMDALQKVLLEQDQFHTAELIIDAAKKGLKIGEAPVTVLKRHSGTSKKGRDLIYGLNFTKTILKSWLRK